MEIEWIKRETSVTIPKGHKGGAITPPHRWELSHGDDGAYDFSDDDDDLYDVHFKCEKCGGGMRIQLRSPYNLADIGSERSFDMTQEAFDSMLEQEVNADPYFQYIGL